MSATSSGSDKRDDGSPPGALGSSTKEIGEGTEGKVDNACNSQTHSTPHRAQCETNHTSIPAHTHSTDETHQDGASCHGDKGAKLGVQKNGLTSMAEKGSNSEQKCKGKSSYTEVVGTQSGRNEDSESSVEDEDQSEDVKSLGGKGGKRVKTCSITRSDNDARDHRDEAVQEGEKITLDENHRGKSDCNSLPKGNEQKNKSDGAIPGVKDEKPDQKSGCNDTEKSISVNESNIDDVAMQEAKIENHDQNSELKHTSKRPVGNENDIDEGAMQRARDEKHDQNNGNKDIDNRPGRNEKDTDNKIRPSVKNENNGDGDTEERPMKYEKNDKGDITTEAVKEESPDVNKKINNTKKEFRENEKKDHPYNGTTKDQADKTKSISQARNLELSDKTASVLGDPDKPFDDSDGGTKESKDKGALPETPPLTQTAQPCNQMDYYACHQDEVGATHSEASHETSSSSQSQDDYTILDKQLDGVIDEILTERNLKESIEERKKSAREKLKSFFLAKVMDGSLSQRSHYPCATKSMPLQIFDSDIHITETRRGDAKGVMQGGGAEDGPSSSQDKLGYGKTRKTPNPEAGKPPLPQSPKIPAETNRKDARAARREQNARDKPSSSQHNQANDLTDPSKCTTDPDDEIQFIDSEENRQGPQEQSTPQTMGGISLHGKTSRALNPKAGDSHFSKSCSSTGKTSRALNPKAGDSHFSKSCSSTEKTSSTPNPEAGKPPLPQSPKIPAETNRKDARAARREQNARDKPSSSQHNQANDPTDPSKCTTDPDDEIQFIDSEENRQGPQEQSTLQTKGAVSLHEKTSWTPNPKAGDSHFSKSCSSAGHALLSIQWNMKQETKGNEPFEIILYNGKRIKYVIQITCMPEDFYRLKFMFCNTNTVEDLSKSLLEIDCTLKSGTYEVHLGRKILSDKSEIIKDKIEGVINNVKATSNIQVHCAEIRIAEDKLVKKCEEFSSEFKRGNIAVYEKGKRVWIVGRNNEEMEVLEKRLIEDNVLEKAPYCSKDSKGYTIRYEENPRGPPGQTTLPDSSETMYAKLLHEKGMKNEKEIRRLPTPPTSGSGVAHMSKTYIKGPSTSSMKDSEMNQHHERDNFNPTLSTTHDNKSVVVEDKGGGSPISPGSLKASGPGILSVQWTREQEMKEFEIALYQDETLTFIIQIACRPSENYILRFIFDNENTAKNLQKILSEQGYELKTGTYEIHIKKSTKPPELIRDEIEKAIITVKGIWNIHVHCTVTTFADYKLVEKCKAISTACAEGNVAVYVEDKKIWMIGRNEKELKKLEEKLMEECFVYEDQIQDLTETMYNSKDNLLIALGKGSPIPADGEKLLSQSCSAVASQALTSQTGMSRKTTAKRDGTQSLRFSRPGSSSSELPGPEVLCIQWSERKEEQIEGDEMFDISLYRNNTLRYVIQIACRPDEYHSLLFMFYNESTIEALRKILYEKGYALTNDTQKMRIRTKSLEKDPELIKVEVKEVIKKLAIDFSIQARCVMSNFADGKVAEKCIEVSRECERDNIKVYVEDKDVWIVGCNTDELKKVEKRLVQEAALLKDVLQDSNRTTDSSNDNILIALGGQEKKFGPLKIGSSKELRMIELECSKQDYYKLFMIFDESFLAKHNAVFCSTGKSACLATLLSKSAFKWSGIGWFNVAVQDVEDFVVNMLPTIEVVCQQQNNSSRSKFELCKEKVYKCCNEDVQLYSDEDDANCLWFVFEKSNSFLVDKALKQLVHDDLIGKPPSIDFTLTTISLRRLELAICLHFRLLDKLRQRHQENVKEVFIDQQDCALKITLRSDYESAIGHDIRSFIDKVVASKNIIKDISDCFFAFLEKPAVRKEIGDELPYYIDVLKENREVDVYSNTRADARKVASIIEGLFLQETIDMEDLDPASLILKNKIETWKKETFETVGIETTKTSIHLYGLRRHVELILPQLKSIIKQNKRLPSQNMNIKHEIDKNSHTQADLSDAKFEGEILIGNQEEIKCLMEQDFEKRITEIENEHQCSIKRNMDNFYPLMKNEENGRMWQFKNGQKVYFEKADLQAIHTKCVVRFLPNTSMQESKLDVQFKPVKEIQSAGILVANVTLPVWSDGTNKEKDQLRNCILLLFQCLREKNMSSVTIPVMFDDTLQWPETQLLKQMLFLRRDFVDTTVFCHAVEEKYNKLLPIFEDLKDNPESEKICIRIERKKFTDVKVQVLVNTVGSDLKLDQGYVSSSILSAAGEGIQMEACQKFPKGLPGGDVLVTDAYKLREKGIKKVFHGSLLFWKDYGSIADLKSFVAKCLHLATKFGMTSIAFPALGTGNLGYPHRYVASAMFETVRSFMECSVYSSVKEVVFNVYDEKSVQAFFTEEKKYLNRPCLSGTFLPRTYRFPSSNLTFELYFGEVWTRDVKGLAVLYDINEIYQKDDKVCVVECGWHAQNFGRKQNEKQQLKSGKIRIIKNNVSRPVDWLFYLTWHDDGDIVDVAMKSAEENSLDSVAFVISKTDMVAVKLQKIIKSIFDACAKSQTRKVTPLKRVILVVDPDLSAEACKTVEGDPFVWFETHRKRCRLWFECKSQDGLHIAKREVMSAIDSFKNKTRRQHDNDGTSCLKPQTNEKGCVTPNESIQDANTKVLFIERKEDSMGSTENCSLILTILSEHFTEKGDDFVRKQLQKDLLKLTVPPEIIFPFLNERDALLKFKNYKDSEKFKDSFRHDSIQLKDFPKQAVSCVNAILSKTAMARFIKQGWTPDDIAERSGVSFKKRNGSLVLEGSLPEIQAAREFIKNACYQAKAVMKEPENEDDNLEYVNNLNTMESINRVQTEKTLSKSFQDNPNPMIKDQKVSIISSGCSKDDFQKQDINAANRLLSSVNVQEPKNQTIRERVRVLIPVFDYKVLEKFFSLPSEVTSKVDIRRRSSEHVEILGNSDTVKPYEDTKKKIESMHKILINVSRNLFCHIEKHLKFHEEQLRMIFSDANILIFDQNVFVIATANVPERTIKDIFLSSKGKIEGKKGDKRGQQVQLPVFEQQTMSAKPLFGKKDKYVYVMQGNVFSDWLEGYDCLVNPTNEYLNLGMKGGLSAAVHEQAGKEVQEECSDIVHRKKKIEIGDCVVTKAGNLKYKHIIHAVVRLWKGFSSTKDQNQDALGHIKGVVTKCLSLASKEKMKSIVFPAIGSGQSGIPSILLANGYRSGCESFFLQGKTSLKHILFLIDQTDFFSLVEMTFQTPLPWCSYSRDIDEYTYFFQSCRIVVAKRDVLKEKNVDALVVLEDPYLEGKGQLANHVFQSAEEIYKISRRKFKRKSQLVGSAFACCYRGTLDYKTIVHIIMENTTNKRWTENDVLHYKSCISNALSKLKVQDTSVAMKLFVGGNEDGKVMMHFAKALTEAVIEHIENGSTLQEILVLNTSGLRNDLVNGELKRYTKNACKANTYFENEVFLNCEFGSLV